jgi:hypothetical protein
VRRVLADERAGARLALPLLAVGAAAGAVLAGGEPAVPLLALAALLSGVQGLGTD